MHKGNLENDLKKMKNIKCHGELDLVLLLILAQLVHLQIGI